MRTATHAPPRAQSDAQVAQIAASIRDFSWTNPVLLDVQSGVVAGHGRVSAVRKRRFNAAPRVG